MNYKKYNKTFDKYHSKRKNSRYKRLSNNKLTGGSKNSYIPVIHKLPKLENSILKEKIDFQLSTNIDYPNFSLGFHHYIHQNKDKMEITKQFKGKKKVYLVMNNFERYIDDYDNDIGGVSKAYFDLDPKPNILSRAFYKLWELLFMFDLIPLNKQNFISAHLAEGPGSFIQATMFYRDKFCKKNISDKDKYYAVTLHPENLKKYIPPLEKSFTEYYKKEKPVRFYQHRTFPKHISRSSTKKDNGDLTNPKTIKLFSEDIGKNKADFITADGGFDWKNENVQEQEAFKLILAQIISAIKIQAKGGNFVCKFFESFTFTTVKLICILSSLYDEVYLVKPLMSRKSNSEKYLVCLNFNNNITDNQFKDLESVLIAMLKNKDNIIGLYPNFNIPKIYLTAITKANTEIANRQLVSINKIVDFIQKQNYRGDVYHDRREKQINAAKFWLDKFFPDTKDFENAKKKIVDETIKEIENSNKNVENLSKLIY